MKISKIIKLTAFALFVCTLQAQAAVAIIVNPSNTEVLDEKAIAKIFLGKAKSFPSGAGVIPVDLAQSSATRITFGETVLDKSESQMKAYWAKLMFSGKGTPPKEVATDAEVLELVAKNPSIIGYIDASSVTEKVKVVHQF